MMVPSFLWRSGACSTTEAEKALVAAPVAMPWMVRAAMTQPTFGANTNMSIAPSSTRSAPTRRGRRPMWSDSDPATSRAASRPSAQEAKATVSTQAGKCHCCSKTTSSGVGAPAAR
jgi:hypothetical protein